MDIIEVTPIKLACAPEKPCEDFDEDCDEVKNKTKCWLYQPEKGLCPYLQGERNGHH